MSKALLLVASVTAGAASVAAIAVLAPAVLAAKAAVISPTIIGSPAANANTTSATFTFTSSPAGLQMQCQLDTTPTFASCTSPKTYSALSQGSHNFQVKAISGSNESIPTAYTWKVDTVTPPAPTFTATPAATSNTSNPSFSFTDGEVGVSYLCKLDTAASIACSNPQSYTNLAQGSHTLAVQARDAAGNTSTATAYSWTVDTVPPPSPVLTQKPNDPSVGATQLFAFSDTEPGVTFECSGEKAAFAACTSPYSYVVNTSNSGQHPFAVHAIDAAGNVSADTSYKFKVTMDKSTSGVPFSISGSARGMTIGVWKSIPVHVTNPNVDPIYVTALTVSVSSDSSPTGCPSANNIELQQSNISTTVRLQVPGNSAIDLPVTAQGITQPQMRLKDLPGVNQDICKSKSFTVTFTATANN